MKPQTLPPSLAEYLDEDTISATEQPAHYNCRCFAQPVEFTEEQLQNFRREQRIVMWRRQSLRCANYTAIAIILALFMWLAAEIFVAFHSGRVNQIIHQQAPHMRVAMNEARL